jgi:hypothetical protein
MSREVYANPLAGEGDLEGFVVEGPAVMSYPMGRLRLESGASPERGQPANFVVWCPRRMPPSFVMEWSFWPLRQPGLAMVFFAARGRGGESVLDPSLAPRNGEYDGYRYGDIDTLHLSWFRRSNPEERAMHTVNLRQSRGFRLVAQGADPIPDVGDARPPYRLRLALVQGQVSFAVGGLELLCWSGGRPGGTQPEPGWVGFRQMAPLIAEYADLRVSLP